MYHISQAVIQQILLKLGHSVVGKDGAPYKSLSIISATSMNGLDGLRFKYVGFETVYEQGKVINKPFEVII